MSVRRRCRNEIEQLHQFFTDWFTGVVRDSDANFARVAGVLADDFVLVSPDGRVYDRASILSVIRRGHGRRAPDAFLISVDSFDVRCADGALCVATYRERQRIEGDDTCRISTAVFRERPLTPNGVQWVHLHETWEAPAEAE
ncbi:MAG: DUF4440 domain-containing protein [Deltaproteobacteria bacterium]|nr:MAG: DUF4440 domain-containing protein [Deltaproteobacteria bacterium]